ncbi:MAG: PIG-L deacetylase family protein [Candidatus Limnocylindria bacterium]
MLGLSLDVPAGRPLRVLAVGAHSDDIEIGAGGTVIRLVRERPDVEVRWVVLSALDERADEARASAKRLLAGAASRDIVVEAFRERFFPHLPELKERFDLLAVEGEPPDLVLGPRAADLHQDHATVAALVRQTFRDQLVLEYEIPKVEADLGRPDLYVELSEADVEAKLRHLPAAFASQRSQTWFREDLFRGLLALRGMEGGAASGYAEAFTVPRTLVRQLG